MVFAATKVIQQFIHNQQQTVIGIHVVKRNHHILESALAVGNLVGLRKGVYDTHCLQMLFHLAHEDIPQRHGGRPNFRADHFELTGDPLRSLSHPFIGKCIDEIFMLSNNGDHGHQVRLASTVVAYDEKSFVIRRLVEL